MQRPFSLKSAERTVFQTSFVDGLWDVLIGCIILELAVAPFLSVYLGDFWSSMVFLPFWGLVYLAIWLVRKYVVIPRIGVVQFGKQRKQKLRRFSIWMVALNTLALGAGILVLVFSTQRPGGPFLAVFGSYSILLGLILLVSFSIAAYLLDYSRLNAYGFLLFTASLVGEWLSSQYGATHHGFPIVFGFSAAVMIGVGLGLFMHFLRKYPVIPPEGGPNA